MFSSHINLNSSRCHVSGSNGDGRRLGGPSVGGSTADVDYPPPPPPKRKRLVDSDCELRGVENTNTYEPRGSNRNRNRKLKLRRIDAEIEQLNSKTELAAAELAILEQNTHHGAQEAPNTNNIGNERLKHLESEVARLKLKLVEAEINKLKTAVANAESAIKTEMELETETEEPLNSVNIVHHEFDIIPQQQHEHERGVVATEEEEEEEYELELDFEFDKLNL